MPLTRNPESLTGVGVPEGIHVSRPKPCQRLLTSRPQPYLAAENARAWASPTATVMSEFGVSDSTIDASVSQIGALSSYSTADPVQPTNISRR